MNSLIVLLTAIIFYLLGRFANTEEEKRITKQVIHKLSTKKTGIVDLKKPQEIYEDMSKSETDKKVDEAMSDLLKATL
jgi:hypothetical protein